MAPSSQPAEHTYTFRITLLGVAPAVWRMVACPGSMSLATLHTVIQSAMGWKRAHPYEFEIAAKIYREPVKDDETEGLVDPRSVTLEALALEPRSTLNYLYDRGDDWVHQIIVEGVAPRSTAAGLPLLLGGAGACPPESSGGPGGYAELLAALRHPTSEAGKEAIAKIGQDADPNSWNPASAVQQLAQLMAPAAPVPVPPPPADPSPVPQSPQQQGSHKKQKGRRGR